ncbi:UNVERIFIED_CONTAM: protein-tyrosine phosphatase/ribose 5-phosphate isomerase B [Acetivibrio alkalicellulosi]
MKKVLFVCTGNTCRSSMAEGIFNKMALDMDKQDDLKAFSAGVCAFDGDGANPHAIKVLNEVFGIDISSHRSAKLKDSHIENAYLILAMTKNHKNTIVSLFPQAIDKTFSLKEYVLGDNVTKDSLDVHDPYGRPIIVYENCARDLKNIIEKLITRLEND